MDINKQIDKVYDNLPGTKACIFNDWSQEQKESYCNWANSLIQRKQPESAAGREAFIMANKAYRDENWFDIFNKMLNILSDESLTLVPCVSLHDGVLLGEGKCLALLHKNEGVVLLLSYGPTVPIFKAMFPSSSRVQR